MRWLLRRLDIFPNAYYNYKKHRKAAYLAEKQRTNERIEAIYHDHGGTPGYRTVKVYLEREGIVLSNQTVHKRMNQELGIKSVTRRKRPEYRKGTAHKVFPNLLEQDFACDEINTKWCTDFTYLFLEDGSKRYNCTMGNHGMPFNSRGS